MKIIVCIKQVPSSSVPTDDFGNLDRSRAGGQLNPRDSYALEAALQLGKALDGQVTALTMGPESAGEVLKTAFTLGVSQGVLLSDPAFAGADVYATAYTLAKGIEALGGADLVICGQQSTDGDTAQLPSSLAVQLGIPVLGWVKSIELGQNGLTLLQELSQGTQKTTISFPCLLAVGEGIGRPRIPSLRDQLRAKSRQAQVLNLRDLPDTDPEHYGRRASPTRVIHAEAAPQKQKHSPTSLNGEKGAERILQALREESPYE